MVQAKIKINDIEFIIDFEDEKDLESKISKVDFSKAHELLSKKFGLNDNKKSGPDDYSDLFSINSTGKVQLKKFPKKDRDLVKLAVFFSPDGLTTNEIRDITGLSNPRAYMPAKDFLKRGEKYTLGADSKKYVIQKLIPKVREQD